jgi:hypothetical protein
MLATSGARKCEEPEQFVLLRSVIELSVSLLLSRGIEQNKLEADRGECSDILKQW